MLLSSSLRLLKHRRWIRQSNLQFYPIYRKKEEEVKGEEVSPVEEKGEQEKKEDEKQEEIP